MTLTDLYFAYGGDMDFATLRARAGGAQVVSPARLEGYRLAFFGHNPVWDSGMETLVADTKAETWGVLYRLLAAEWIGSIPAWVLGSMARVCTSTIPWMWSRQASIGFRFERTGSRFSASLASRAPSTLPS
jgi:hypothetical protein